MKRIFFKEGSEYINMTAGQRLQEGIQDIGIEENFFIVSDELADKLEGEIEKTEYVTAIDLVKNSNTKAEVYDNYSFVTCLLKRDNLEAQYECQEAYDILSKEIKLFEEYYQQSDESWTDIYIAEDGTKYAVYGNGQIEGCAEFIVLELG